MIDYNGTLIFKGNIARGKPTSQSSNFYSCSKNICRGNASRAVDGSTNSIFGADSCTHTKYQKNPWWKVDLQKREVVRKVSLTNRGDCCAERLRQVEVRVGDNGCSYSKNPVYVDDIVLVASSVVDDCFY